MKSILLKLLILSFFIGINVSEGYSQESNKILWTANWSNDNKYIAIGGDDKKIRIYNGETFEFLKVYENESEVKRLRWHPKQNILGVAAVDDGSKIIDVETDKITEFKGVKNVGGRAIAWNYNGELIAIADYEGVLTIWTKEGKNLKTIKKDNTKSYVAIDWHPYKNEIIALSDYVRIYNSKGDLLKKFNHRDEKVLMLCVKWHKSGKYFVIGDYGDTIVPYKPVLQFWKFDGTLIKEIDTSKAEYRNISWNKKGNRLTSASDALRIWSKKGKLLSTGLSQDKLWGVDWSSDGKYIVTSSNNGKIIIWDKNARIIKVLN